jgi:hypothetical protein
MSALDLDALEAEFARRIVDHEYLDMDDIRPLITRLRAAEARTAWQPIETAPPPAEEWLRVAWEGCAGYRYARLDEKGWWVAEAGRFYEDAYAEEPPTHWCRCGRLTWPLPAAPEAPHG